MNWLKNNHLWCSFYVLLFTVLIFPFQDGDLFFYLGLGRLIFQSGSIPAQDPYLFAFKNWHVYHEWLSYVVFYSFYLLARWKGVIVLKLLLWLGVFTVLHRGARKWRLQETPVFLVLLMAAVVCSHRFVERSSLFSDVAVAGMTLVFLSSRESDTSWRWLFPITFAVWVNLHPGFVLGLALFTVFAITRWREIRIWQSLILSYLAVLLNPLFLDGALYPLRTVFKEDWKLYRRLNFEWMPTFEEPFLSTWEVRFLIALLVVTLVLIMASAVQKKRGSLFAGLAFLFFLFLAQKASRFMPTSALGFAALSFWSLYELQWKWPKRWNEAGRVVLTAGFLLGGAWIFANGYQTAAGPRSFGVGPDTSQFPVKAVDFIERNHLQGHFFNQYEWGSYLLWALDRPNSLFIHGHIDDPQILARDYHGLNTTLDFFRESIRRYDFKYFILEKARLNVRPAPVILRHLQTLPLIYEDETTAIWQVQ